MPQSISFDIWLRYCKWYWHSKCEPMCNFEGGSQLCYVFTHCFAMDIVHNWAIEHKYLLLPCTVQNWPLWKNKFAMLYKHRHSWQRWTKQGRMSVSRRASFAAGIAAVRRWAMPSFLSTQPASSLCVILEAQLFWLCNFNPTSNQATACNQKLKVLFSTVLRL